MSGAPLKHIRKDGSHGIHRPHQIGIDNLLDGLRHEIAALGVATADARVSDHDIDGPELATKFIRRSLQGPLISDIQVITTCPSSRNFAARGKIL